MTMVRQMRVELFGGDAGPMLACKAGDAVIDEAKRARIQELAGGR